MPRPEQLEDMRVPFNSLELAADEQHPIDRVFHIPITDQTDGNTIQLSFTLLKRQRGNLFSPWRACRPTNHEIAAALTAAARLPFHMPH